MNVRRFRSIVSAIALAAGLAPGAVGQGPDLVNGGVKPDLFLLYTGDVIGYLDPCG